MGNAHPYVYIYTHHIHITKLRDIPKVEIDACVILSILANNIGTLTPGVSFPKSKHMRQITWTSPSHLPSVRSHPGPAEAMA